MTAADRMRGGHAESVQPGQGVLTYFEHGPLKDCLDQTGKVLAVTPGGAAAGPVAEVEWFDFVTRRTVRVETVPLDSRKGPVWLLFPTVAAMLKHCFEVEVQSLGEARSARDQAKAKLRGDSPWNGKAWALRAGHGVMTRHTSGPLKGLVDKIGTVVAVTPGSGGPVAKIEWMDPFSRRAIRAETFAVSSFVGRPWHLYERVADMMDDAMAVELPARIAKMDDIDEAKAKASGEPFTRGRVQIVCV